MLPSAFTRNLPELEDTLEEVLVDVVEVVEAEVLVFEVEVLVDVLVEVFDVDVAELVEVAGQPLTTP